MLKIIRSSFLLLVTFVVFSLLSVVTYAANSFSEYCNNPVGEQKKTVEALFGFFKPKNGCAEIEERIRFSKKVNLGGMSDISFFQFFPEIEKITIGNTRGPSTNIDLSYITPLKHLIRLSIEDDSIDDLTPLSQLEALQYVQIRSLGVTDISPLNNLTNLELLSVGGNVNELPVLDNLKKLKILKIPNSNLKSIENIKYLINLEEVFLIKNQISSLEGVEHLTKLDKLNVGSNNISDLSPVSGLVNLGNITIVNNFDIDDLSPLVPLKKLRRVGTSYLRMKPCSPQSFEEIKKGVSCENSKWTNFKKRWLGFLD